MDTTTFAIGWLRGFFDGEGHANVGAKSISMANTEQDLIDECCRNLDLLGIAFNVYRQPNKPPRKPIMRVMVNRRVDVQRFIEIVGTSASYKRASMDKITEWFNAHPMPNGRGNPVTLTADEISAMRSIGMTDRQIAIESGCSPHTVFIRARDGGISRSYRSGPQPDPEEVRHAYEVEKLSLRELGERFGYRSTTIVKFMKRHGIERRGFGRHNR